MNSRSTIIFLRMRARKLNGQKKSTVLCSLKGAEYKSCGQGCQVSAQLPQALTPMLDKRLEASPEGLGTGQGDTFFFFFLDLAWQTS